jgi:hypothetical protein
MSLKSVLLMLLIAGFVLGAALCAGCLGDREQPDGRVSATQPPAPETGGVSGGTQPVVGETTIPIPIPIGS